MSRLPPGVSSSSPSLIFLGFSIDPLRSSFSLLRFSFGIRGRGLMALTPTPSNSIKVPPVPAPNNPGNYNSTVSNTPGLMGTSRETQAALAAAVTPALLGASANVGIFGQSELDNGVGVQGTSSGQNGIGVEATSQSGHAIHKPVRLATPMRSW